MCNSFPVELWVRKGVQKIMTPPKPKVDAQQLSTEPVTCWRGSHG